MEEGASAIGCDPSFVALSGLVACAGAVGLSRALRIKEGWDEDAILWGVIIGESGTAKTPALALAMEPLHAIEAANVRAHRRALKEHEKALQAFDLEFSKWKKKKDGSEPPEKPDEPVCTRLVVSDATAPAVAPILENNPRGVLLCRDEIDGWVQSIGEYTGGLSGDAARWLSAHSGAPWTVDRRSSSTPIMIPHAAVSIVGGIQPGVLERAFGEEHRENGLLARVLLVMPPRLPRRWTDAEVGTKTREAYARLLNGLLELSPREVKLHDSDGHEYEEQQPVALRMDQWALARFKSYVNEHGLEQVELDGELAAAWSKLESGAARLSLIVHLIRVAGGDQSVETEVVDAGLVNAGIILADWFGYEARRTYGRLRESEEIRSRRELAEWIARKGGRVTPREVVQGRRGFREVGVAGAEAALEGLVRLHLGRWETSTPGPRGGRPSRAFVLTAVSTSTKPPVAPAEGGFVDVDTTKGPGSAQVNVIRRPSSAVDDGDDEEVVEWTA